MAANKCLAWSLSIVLAMTAIGASAGVRDNAEEQLAHAERLAAGGYFFDARPAMESILKNAADETPVKVMAARALGELLLRMGKVEEAQALLLKSATQARDMRRDDLLIPAAMALGNLYTYREEFSSAGNSYREVLEHAKGPVQRAAARINLAALPDTEDREATALLQASFVELEEASAAARSTGWLLASLGYQALQRQRRAPAFRVHLRALAFRALNESFAQARRLADNRLASESLGWMALLYSQDGRLDEALSLTDRAIIEAQAVAAEDLLYKWEAQRGNFLYEKNDIKGTLDAYQHSVSHIAAIRSDVPLSGYGHRSKFRTDLEPIYRRFADLLLEHAAELERQNQNGVEALLKKAQKTVEAMRAGELNDYFKDACAVVQRPLLQIQGFSSGTAVLYPILFDDRVELLLDAGGKMYRFSSPVSELKTDVERLLGSVQFPENGTLQEFSKDKAESLYRTLVAPLEDRLHADHIHTLVFVPDGVLRQLPLSMLWDGQHYLVETYAIATVPGITLFDPKPIPRDSVQGLLAGLSRLGPVVDMLPAEARNAWLTAGMNRRGGARRRPVAEASDAVDTRFATDRESENERLKDLMELPGVKEEIEALAKMMPSRQLPDQDFLLKRFKDELSKNYRIVHIASHGWFSGKPENSFIVTYDQLLYLDGMEELFKSEAFSDQPVELLTLSTCDTAKGDELSPLGFSGVAVKSGARSVLGSLWSVADAQAKRLLPDFYHFMLQEKMPKAQALRQAQLKALKTDGREHPYYWAPYLLIGNWL